MIEKYSNLSAEKIAGWWKIDSVETGQIDWEQPDKEGKLINALPGEDSQEQLYNGDGPADIMGPAIDKVVEQYQSAWGRPPKRDEIYAVVNFVTNPMVDSGEIGK